MSKVSVKPHRAAIVGLGAMGRRHARVLSELRERFELTALHDIDARARDLDGVPVVGSEAQAIDRAEVVIVATPIHTHTEIVARALAAGRHVLVEKPMCATALEGQALVAASARGPGRLYVGHSERFNPVVRALARLVRADRVLSVDLRRAGPPSRSLDCGVLLNLGVHDLDLVAYLGGGDATLRGAIASAAPASPYEDVAHVLLTTRDGVLGHVHVDRTAPERRREIVLATSRWIYRGDLLAHRLVRTCCDTASRTDVPLPLDEPLAAQATALADALDGVPSRELATAIDGARAVGLAERAAGSLALSDEAEKLSVLPLP